MEEKTIYPYRDIETRQDEIGELFQKGKGMQFKKVAIERLIGARIATSTKPILSDSKVCRRLPSNTKDEEIGSEGHVYRSSTTDGDLHMEDDEVHGENQVTDRVVL